MGNANNLDQPSWIRRVGLMVLDHCDPGVRALGSGVLDHCDLRWVSTRDLGAAFLATNFLRPNNLLPCRGADAISSLSLIAL